MELVILCYADGRPLATVGEAPPNHAERVAAMASSFLALSETFAKEASHGRCSYATITSAQGLLVAVRVPSPRKLYVLCAAASRSDNLAMILRRTLDCADSLATVLP
ncbi:putative regulator of Ras-like GTPase activity (Roadblock/LC7/MglB family) [Tahibacter aquaticus]|uniref:Putative regulator of Ras-like GTPase activity (Roadblock/LC7/MglB family) n=2 Tax=Tahibacter aquaticus TaxID=520092 RepID=A0A4R6Z0L3_9GAMM|nr:putative regulator of Ras-like GTPase activity (Roadblock/LC7/MglB family) [Tahibacter aquaticus]